ncbi:hypothetical protein JVX92_14895 (plasmid) [Microbacterium hominis]|uniref:hypothetical protein n=1 Tax=Microbacterium hominis TaxID=162426 RepID=UPI001962ADBE|nr:hypothetical protein [Microbacterium hominis]QRY42322.1 hypothetical protein JVX92_14895 [Microbacterium hominis]
MENTPDVRGGPARKASLGEQRPGVDPFGICELYAAGLIPRDRLIDELTQVRQLLAGGLDDLVVSGPGSTADLERALRQGLIGDDLFDEVANRLGRACSGDIESHLL